MKHDEKQESAGLRLFNKNQREHIEELTSQRDYFIHVAGDGGYYPPVSIEKALKDYESHKTTNKHKGMTIGWIKTTDRRPSVGSDVYVWTLLRRGGSIRVARPGKVEKTGVGAIQVHDSSAKIVYRLFDYWMPRDALAGPITKEG
jgi:hypothetical protein